MIVPLRELLQQFTIAAKSTYLCKAIGPKMLSGVDAVPSKDMEGRVRVLSGVILAGLLCVPAAHADPSAPLADPFLSRPQPSSEGAFQEYRERRLERALREGTVTPEEAEQLRRRWRESVSPPALERLMPEEREQLRQYAERRRRDRAQLIDSLSPDQREQLRRRVQAGQFDRQQLLDILTPEQRQQFLSNEMSRRHDRERYIRELESRTRQNPRRPPAISPE